MSRRLFRKYSTCYWRERSNLNLGKRLEISPGTARHPNPTLFLASLLDSDLPIPKIEDAMSTENVGRICFFKHSLVFLCEESLFGENEWFVKKMQEYTTSLQRTKTPWHLVKPLFLLKILDGLYANLAACTKLTEGSMRAIKSFQQAADYFPRGELSKNSSNVNSSSLAKSFCSSLQSLPTEGNGKSVGLWLECKIMHLYYLMGD